MCFYLTASLTSSVFHFSFPIQTILTRGKRLIHTLFHMFLSFLITVLNWLKSSQGGSQSAVLFCILQTTQLLPSLPIKTLTHSCRLAALFCCGLFHISKVPIAKGFGRAATFSFPHKWSHHSIATAGVRISHCQVPIFHCEMPLTSTLCWGVEVRFQLHHPAVSCHWPASSCCAPVPCPNCGGQGANEVMEFQVDTYYLD